MNKFLGICFLLSAFGLKATAGTVETIDRHTITTAESVFPFRIVAEKDGMVAAIFDTSSNGNNSIIRGRANSGSNFVNLLELPSSLPYGLTLGSDNQIHASVAVYPPNSAAVTTIFSGSFDSGSMVQKFSVDPEATSTIRTFGYNLIEMEKSFFMAADVKYLGEEPKTCSILKGEGEKLTSIFDVKGSTRSACRSITSFKGNIFVGGYRFVNDVTVPFFLRSLDGGVTWEESNQIDDLSGFSNHGFATQDGTLFFTGYNYNETGPKFASGVWRSADKGLTWQEMKIPIVDGYDREHAGMLQQNPLDGTLYLMSEAYSETLPELSVLRSSTDNGVTWKVENTYIGEAGLGAESHALAFDPDGTLYLAYGSRETVGWSIVFRKFEQ